MIHLPAKHVYDEMMSLQQLTRAAISDAGNGGFEPTLVVKTKSLALKYLLKAPQIRFFIGHATNNRMFYGVLIDDDREFPFGLWSLVERADELEAVKQIASGQQFMLALFNEAVVNICGGLLRLHGCVLTGLFDEVALSPVGESDDAEEEVSASLEAWKTTGASLTVLSSDGSHNWGPNTCFYVTNQLQTSQLNLTYADEGGQQEQLAAWIIDSLHIDGVFQNPIARESVPRELCDLLLTHEFGTMLFESKSLSILSRSDTPARGKLQADVSKHIKKALKQLTGACKNLRAGIEIVSQKSERINALANVPQHCIVIIPDLTLINGIETDLFVELFEFAKKTGAFVNIVDPSQLFSLMMDANNLSHRGQFTTPLMAFDYLLIRRCDSMIKSRDPGVITLCRFESSTD